MLNRLRNRKLSSMNIIQHGHKVAFIFCGECQ